MIPALVFYCHPQSSPASLCLLFSASLLIFAGLWVFDHYKGGLGIPEEGKGGADEKVWARWRKWYAAIQERDSIKGTTSETEHYLSIYQRYADDKAQSELAKATRKGRGVP